MTNPVIGKHIKQWKSTKKAVIEQNNETRKKYRTNNENTENH